MTEPTLEFSKYVQEVLNETTHSVNGNSMEATIDRINTSSSDQKNHPKNSPFPPEFMEGPIPYQELSQSCHLVR
ncbi:hypothetical protein HMI55_006199 [Coelomomyces lativittatus]|nr:hypothetical protein HMI55_006199 [Coelomomyces lativittatus]